MRPDLQHIRFHGLVTAGAAGARRPPASMTARAAPLSFDQPVLAMGSLGRDVLWRSGLNPDAYRDAPVLRRTNACFRALRVSGDDEARQAIAPGGDALGRALDTLLLGVSGFFRDPEVFDTLRAQVLPRLASGGGALRVLSVGCSNGAELYSVAMLLDEAGALERTRLVGLDCRASAIESATRAIYPVEDAGMVPDALRTRMFQFTPDGVRVADHLRARAEFQVGDATASLPAGPWDLVLCRNLTIYLRTPVTDRLLEAIVERLTPSGTLVLGRAERPAASMPLVPVARCVYQRHE
jgi:chemotaxis methyl-accepting protein methylase